MVNPSITDVPFLPRNLTEEINLSLLLNVAFNLYQTSVATYQHALQLATSS